MCHLVSLWTAVSRCPRTYSGRRPAARTVGVHRRLSTDGHGRAAPAAGSGLTYAAEFFLSLSRDRYGYRFLTASPAKHRQNAGCSYPYSPQSRYESSARGRRRPLSRRGHRWRIVGLVGSPLTATRRPLLRTPVTPSTGVDVCSPGDYVGITGHLPSALRAAAVRAAVRCSGAQRDRCRPGLGWPPAGAAPAGGHSARPG
jgi:hypothetical protein